MPVCSKTLPSRSFCPAYTACDRPALTGRHSSQRWCWGLGLQQQTWMRHSSSSRTKTSIKCLHTKHWYKEPVNSRFTVRKLDLPDEEYVDQELLNKTKSLAGSLLFPVGMVKARLCLLCGQGSQVCKRSEQGGIQGSTQHNEVHGTGIRVSCTLSFPAIGQATI